VVGGGDTAQAQAEGFKLLALIRAYMTHGHFKADVDPLKLGEVYGSGINAIFKNPGEQYKKLLDIEHYGFTEADLGKTFHVHLPQWGGLLGQKTEWTLAEIVETMSNAYCGKVGIEYMHIPDRD
jgi:2-oxoglutarate dehydrogenase E1 component